MRRTILLAGVLLSVVPLGSDSPKEYDDRMTVDQLEGTWHRIEIEINGRKDKPVLIEVMTCRSQTFTSNYSDGGTIEGRFRIDHTYKPPHLDWMPSGDRWEGKTHPFIYQIDGDTLRIGGINNGGMRPQGFNDGGIVVYTYKRGEVARDRHPANFISRN